MKGYRWFGVVAIVACALTAQVASAQEDFKKLKDQLRIDQNLGDIVPGNLEFRDETGKVVHLKDYFGKKAIIFSPVFYNCKGTCIMITEGVAKAVHSMKAYQPGRDFLVLSVSIHPKETPELAAKTQAIYFDYLGKDKMQAGWHFLTGNQENIQKLTDALGFHYVYDPVKDLVSHPAGIMIVTPSGKISRYFYGFEFSAPLVFDSLRNANEETIGVPVEPQFFNCVHYDPISGKRTIVIENVLKLLGVLTAVILGLSILIMSIKSNRAKGVAHS